MVHIRAIVFKFNSKVRMQWQECTEIFQQKGFVPLVLDSFYVRKSKCLEGFLKEKMERNFSLSLLPEHVCIFSPHTFNSTQINTECRYLTYAFQI